MNNWEARAWSKETITTAQLRNHVRLVIDDCPPTGTPEFLPWFLEWQREAVRLYDRYNWWDLSNANVIHRLKKDAA